MAISELSTTETLLPENTIGFVDHQGRPIDRLNSGGWRAASFIIGNVRLQKCEFIHYPSITLM